MDIWKKTWSFNKKINVWIINISCLLLIQNSRILKISNINVWINEHEQGLNRYIKNSWLIKVERDLNNHGDGYLLFEFAIRCTWVEHDVNVISKNQFNKTVIQTTNIGAKWIFELTHIYQLWIFQSKAIGG